MNIDTPMRDRTDRFGTNPCIDGYEVIALDTGRAIRKYPTLSQATGAAYGLNKALMSGPRALSAVLGADGPPPHEYVGGRNYRPSR